MTDEGWAWSDAWIFVSLVIAGKVGRHRRSPGSRRPEGVRLVDVLATAEHLNQAIPSREEIETGVRRLVGADLVSVRDGWFQVTAAGERLWRDRPRGGLTTTVDSVHGVLNRRYAATDGDWRLDDQDHAAAMVEYTGRFLPPAPRRSMEDPAPVNASPAAVESTVSPTVHPGPA